MHCIQQLMQTSGRKTAEAVGPDRLARDENPPAVRLVNGRFSVQ